MSSLQIETGKHKGKRIKLPAEGLVIGRGESAGLRIASGEISREHCRLVPEGDGFRITDLGSSNGTLVDGTPITEPTLAGPGTRVTVGPASFVVVGASGAVARPKRRAASPNVRKAAKKDEATDDEIDQWLAESVPEEEKRPPGEDTKIMRADGRSESPLKPTRHFDSVAEEAADIIRRHHEAQEV